MLFVQSKTNFYKFLLQFSIVYLLLMEMTIIPRMATVFFTDIFHVYGFLSLVFVTCILAILSGKFTIPIFYKNLFFIFYSLFFIIIALDTINVIYLQTGEISQILWIIKYLALFILFVSSLLVFNVKESVDIILKPYIYLVLIIAISTFFAYSLFWFSDIVISEWVPDFLKKSDEGTGDRKLYFFPYYLSLILFGENHQFFLGIPIVRTSGISIEPSLSTLLATPALFFTKYTSIKYKRVVYFSLALFLLLSFSVTNLTILACIWIIYLIKSKKIITLLLVTSFFIIAISTMETRDERSMLDKFDASNMSNMTTVGLHIQKLTSHELLGYSFFSPRDYTFDILNQTSVIVTYLFYLLVMLFAMYILYQISIKKDYIYLFGMLYVLAHSVKSFTHTYYFMFPYFIMMVVLFLFLISKYEDFSRIKT